MVGCFRIFLIKIFSKSPVYQNLFKSIWLLIFLQLTHTATKAQDKIDSLQKVLLEKRGVDRFDALFEIAYEYTGVDNNKALQYSEQALEVANESGDTSKIVKATRIKASSLRRLERFDQAIRLGQWTLAVAKRHNYKSEIKYLLHSLAIAFTFKADYDKALEYNLESLIIGEAEGNRREISITLNNIGLVYFKLRNYESAIHYYNRSLQVKRESGDNFDLDRLLINLGLCYNQLKKYEEAEKYIASGLKTCGDVCSDEIKISGQFSLGVSNFGQKKFDIALKHFQESYQISKSTNNKRFQAENLVYIGKVFIQQKNSKSAIEALKESETLANTWGYNELLIDAYRQLSILYNETKDFENAADYQSKYILLKDSTYSEHLIDNIAKIQTKYAERENLATIAAKEEVIQRQRSLNFAILIIAILAALLIFVLYRSNRVKKKVNQALSDAKAIIEDQNRQLLSSNYNLDKELKEKNSELEKANESLLRVNEELDNFIYKTSHDIRGPLASLKGMCNVALMDVKDALALNYLKKLDITAEKLNTILTRLLIVNQINNSALGFEKIDFVGIVNDVLMLEKKKGLPPRLKIRKHIDDSIDFYSDKEFVRIILENLIDNAIKFYNDSNRIEPFVDITITEQDQYITIKVIDNGIGISEVHPDKIFQMFSRASERSETGGIGLYITKTATEKLGGSVHLKTTPEGHTEFFVTIPLVPVRVMA